MLKQNLLNQDILKRYVKKWEQTILRCYFIIILETIKR